MAKRGRPAKGEQLALIDVGPENLEQIAPHAKEYKAAMRQRQAALKVEVEQKHIILDLVIEAKLQPLKNGHIKFACEGLEIDLEPRDTVIHVTEIKERKKLAGKSAVVEPPVGEARQTQDAPPGKKSRKKKQRTVANLQGNGDKSMEQIVAETEGQ